MIRPDPELQARYGTTKQADVATAARIAIAILGMSLAKGDEEDHEHEAELLNELARAQEAEKMEAMIGAMKSASQAGVTMARASREKLAFGAFIGKALTQTLPTLAGKAVGAVPGAKSVAQGIGSMGPGWKTKALATGATLGVGYAGYKGMTGVRDYAKNPQGDQQQWGTMRPLKHNVSEWGYPTS